MPRPPAPGVLAALLLGHAIANAQNHLPLDFSQNVQPVNAIYPNLSTLGPEYYSGSVFDFRNVTSLNGQAIDARVSLLGTSGGYEFVGWIPDYDQDAGQPAGDLGIYYRHNGDFNAATGGISWSLTFYQGDGTFTQEALLTDFRLLIYDHDGEPGQSEAIRSHHSDGLYGYQLHDSSGINAHQHGAAVRFDAGGTGKSETSPEGGFIAYYQNTSSVRFDMLATTLPENPAGNNGIFAAIDGDLGLTGGVPTGFGAFVAVPEPSTSALTCAALLLGLLRRSRQTA